MSTKSAGELLAVLVDTNPTFWTNDGMSFEDLLDALCIAINIHLSIRTDNRIAVYGFDAASKDLIFPQDHNLEDEIAVKKSNFEEINTNILKRFCQHLTDSKEGAGPFSKMSAPLSKALCYINSKTAYSETLKTARILIISKAKYRKEEYSSLMNAVFAASKRNIPIDTMVLSDPAKGGISSNTFLIQASYLSKGIHLEVDGKKGLIQYFTQTLLIDTKCREQFPKPNFKKESIQKINIAICQCGCAKEIEKGYVCSVCLRLYCDQSFKKGQASCLTCRRRFDILPEAIEIETFTQGGKEDGAMQME